MSNKRRYGGTKRKHTQIPRWLWVLPFLIGAGIVPTLVRGRVVELYEKALDIWPTQQGITVDFFSYQKAVFLIVAGLAALALLWAKKYKEGFLDHKYNLYVIPVLSYSFFVILSTLLSQYPKTSINGFADRYEGLIVIMGYVLLFLAAMFALDKEDCIRTVLWCIVVPSFIVTGIGAFQYFNLDPYRTDFGKRLILNAQMYAEKENLSFNFTPGSVYTTLFNPNYVGSYCALLIPMLIGLIVYEKKIWHKVVLVTGIFLGVINIYGSKSTAGLVGLLVSAAFVIFILIVSIFRKHPVAILSVITASVLIVGVFLYINFTDYKGLGVIPDLKINNIQEENWYINDLTISGNKIIMDMTGGTLEIRNDMGKMTFHDEAGKQLSANYNNYQYNIDDPRFSGMTFKISNTNLLFTIYPRSSVSFTVIMDSEGFYDVIGTLGKAAPMDRPDAWLFKGYETLGSGRGYIWSRSLPLLFKERPLFGSGPDTYAYVFPQNDVIGKLNTNFQNNTVLVDKPHNMYMQMGINTGLLSLIAIIALFGIFIVRTTRLYWRITFKDRVYFLGLALAGSCIGYMVTGLFNDSDVSAAPMFWVLFGCSVSLNFLIKKRLEASKQG